MASGRSEELFCSVEDQYERYGEGAVAVSSGELQQDKVCVELEQRK